MRLESLEDAVVLESEDDLLTDKHGCPAYVSPEILRTNSQYSGRAADMWGLGVMLYTTSLTHHMGCFVREEERHLKPAEILKIMDKEGKPKHHL